MKKILSLVLCGVMCCTLLTGCGDEEKTNKEHSSSNDESMVSIGVGSFVDYPVKYTNVGDSFNSQITSVINKDTAGWRVLAKNGDVITLVSTGTPLEYAMYYSEENASEAIDNDLNNLYKVLSTDSTYQSNGYSYFTKSGFENNTFDLTTVFNTGLEDINSIHAMNGEELLNLYNDLTEKNLTLDDLYTTTTYLGNGTLGLKDGDIALDLLANGREYYINALVERESGEYYLHYVSSGMLTSTRFDEKPLRIVLNLKSDVKVVDGDGTLENPFKLEL